MISRYIGKALARARYEPLEERGWSATVPGLRGVIATGSTLEACRQALVQVIEEWILVRVARGLAIPRIGGVAIKIKRAV